MEVETSNAWRGWKEGMVVTGSVAAGFAAALATVDRGVEAIA